MPHARGKLPVRWRVLPEGEPPPEPRSWRVVSERGDWTVTERGIVRALATIGDPTVLAEVAAKLGSGTALGRQRAAIVQGGASTGIGAPPSRPRRQTVESR